MSKNCALNEHVNYNIKFEYSFQTKLEICNYNEQSKINNSWKIQKHFEYKYPTLREDTIKRWIKLGSKYFESQIKLKNPQTKRLRTQKAHFEQLESMLI